MRRTFNYTGRRKIARSRIDIAIEGSDPKTRQFSASLNLGGLRFLEDAKVYVEAYYDRALMRFDYGTVGNLRPPANRLLSDLEFTDRVFFRVRVVDEQQLHGRLLGLADEIHTTAPQPARINRASLLPVNAIAGMGQEIWRVNFADRPVLEVNRDIPDITNLIAHDRRVTLLVYPAVVREILTRALVLERYEFGGSGDDWPAKWITFGQRFGSGEPPVYLDDGENVEEVEEWIDAAVAGFANAINARELFIDAVNQETA